MWSDDLGAVAITGASGFVGGALSAAFTASGYRVVALVRPEATDGARSNGVGYSLEHGLERPLPDDVRAVVHCAYDLRERDPSEIERINVVGTQRLADSVGPLPIVLISSMSAFAGTTQTYGRAKLACEDVVAAHGGTSLRLGLVYGMAAGGMVGALRKVSAAPVVPMLTPDPFQYTVHVEDMARCVVEAVTTRPPHGVLGVANPRRVPLSEIVGRLRSSVTMARPRPLSIPIAALHRSLRTAEKMGVRLAFRADSLVGLIRPADEVPHVDYWQAVGITLRDFASEGATSGRSSVDDQFVSLS